MKRFAFLLPAAIAGIAVAVVGVVADLDAGMTYALIGIVGFFVLLSGALHDLGVPAKRRKVVEMHQSAIRAEQWDRPIPPKIRTGFHDWNEDRALANQPVWVVAGRTRFKRFRLQKAQKRGVLLGVGHFADPMLKLPV
jgi:hypothetical protein